MQQTLHSSEPLTKNQSLVMGALSEAARPLSAYTILDRLRDEGFRAPQQVYRTLSQLVDSGLVHRLESLNAFVACRHPDCEGHDVTAFMICENCDRVIEVTDKALARRLRKLAGDAGFALKKTTIEASGSCGDCMTAQAR